jgi:hypothetical protein
MGNGTESDFVRICESSDASKDTSNAFNKYSNPLHNNLQRSIFKTKQFQKCCYLNQYFPSFCCSWRTGRKLAAYEHGFEAVHLQ